MKLISIEWECYSCVHQYSYPLSITSAKSNEEFIFFGIASNGFTVKETSIFESMFCNFFCDDFQLQIESNGTAFSFWNGLQRNFDPNIQHSPKL